MNELLIDLSHSVPHPVPQRQIPKGRRLGQATFLLVVGNAGLLIVESSHHIV